MYNQIVTDPLIGTLFAERYLINFLVARGGMGNIYQVNDIKMGRIVALKLLRSEFSDDPVIVRRFQRETEAISNLKHPNICQMYESGCTPEGIHYFTMEFLEGHALDQVIKEKHVLSPDVAVEYMIQVAHGLCDAHDHGIIHRDLKPANIFIVHEANAVDYIKVLDFGVAKMEENVQEIQEKLTRAGSTLGTPYYMSPEQIQGAEVDARTDIYALGVILWECVFGAPVYPGRNLIEIFNSTMNAKIPKLPQSLKQDANWQKLYDILCKSLQKDREKRFKSMHAFVRALEDYQSQISLNQIHLSLKTPKSLPIWDNIKGIADEAKNVFHRLSPLKLIIIGTIICLCIGSFAATFILLKPADTAEIIESKRETYKFFTDIPAAVKLIKDGKKFDIGQAPASLDLDQKPPFKLQLNSENGKNVEFSVKTQPEGIVGYAINLSPNVVDKPIIHLETRPANAKVNVNGRINLEKTPCDIPVLGRNEIKLTISMKGYKTENIYVQPQGSDIKIQTNLFREQ